MVISQSFFFFLHFLAARRFCSWRRSFLSFSWGVRICYRYSYIIYFYLTIFYLKHILFIKPKTKLALLTCCFFSSMTMSPFPSLFLRVRMESLSSSLIRGMIFFSFPALSTASRSRGSLTSKSTSSKPSITSLSSLRTLPDEARRSRGGEDLELIIGKFPVNALKWLQLSPGRNPYLLKPSW